MDTNIKLRAHLIRVNRERKRLRRAIKAISKSAERWHLVRESCSDDMTKAILSVYQFEINYIVDKALMEKAPPVF